MAISDIQKQKLNSMCMSATDSTLGTELQRVGVAVDTLGTLPFVNGTHTVTAGEQTAGTLTINAGTTINGFIVQIYRANNLLSGEKVTISTTNLTVATNSSTYIVTSGDVINYIVY